MSFNGDLYSTGGADVVMTTSGDMVKYESGARARLPIGTANQILQTKSSLPSWETVDLADTVLTTAGDVLYEDATPALARLPAGSLNDVLTMGASVPAWSAPAGGGKASKVAEATLTSTNQYLTLSFTSIPQADVAYLFGSIEGRKQNSYNTMNSRLNGLSTNTYTYQRSRIYNTSNTQFVTSANTSDISLYSNNSGDPIAVRFWWKINNILNSDGSVNTAYQVHYFHYEVSASNEMWHIGGWNSTAGETDYNQIQLIQFNSAGYLDRGSSIKLYKMEL